MVLIILTIPLIVLLTIAFLFPLVLPNDEGTTFDNLYFFLYVCFNLIWANSYVFMISKYYTLYKKYQETKTELGQYKIKENPK
jgi:predicted ferric reductase